MDRIPFSVVLEAVSRFDVWYMTGPLNRLPIKGQNTCGEGLVSSFRIYDGNAAFGELLEKSRKTEVIAETGQETDEAWITG